MLKITIIICLFLLVKSQQLSVTSKWTAHLGKQYPGVTPLFSRLHDGIAIASFLQDSHRQFHLIVHHYSIQGELRAKCDSIIPSVSKRIWDLKMQSENDSTLAVSWLYSDSTQLGVRVLQVNVAQCSLQDSRVPLYDDVDLVLYVPYYLLPRGDSGLYLFVKSPEICEGVCRLNVGRDDLYSGKGGSGTFITAKDESVVWRIVAVDASDLSQGYYYISEDPLTQLAKIEKLNRSGTVLRTLSTKHNMSSDSFAVSSSHARLSMCSSGSCFLLDSSTFELVLDVSVARNTSSVANTIDAGLAVINEADFAQKVGNDGTSSEPIGLFQQFHQQNCFPRKMYEAHEVAGVYCTGRACMSKSNPKDVFYQVSVAVECLSVL